MEDLLPGKFNADSQAWNEGLEPVGDLALPRLTLVTYNVWFGWDHRYRRCEALLRIVQNCRADVIALQEIMPDFLEVVLEKEWVRAHYRVSDLTGDTLRPYGVLLLSRLPIARLQLYDLPGAMYRKLLVAEYRINGQTLKVAAVHLESERGSAPVRVQQLDRIFPRLQDAPHAVLMGDFNFSPMEGEEQAHIDHRYGDMWTLLGGDEPDFASDVVDLNSTLKRERMKQLLGFDRILLRSGVPGWQPQSIHLLGTEPISPEDANVFPSDHYGLTGRLKWEQE